MDEIIIPLREQVKWLQSLVTVLQARVDRLENEHLFGVEQMNRIEATEKNILDEVAKIMPNQHVIDELTAKLEQDATKLENAAKK